MKNNLLIITLFVLTVSCHDETFYQLQLVIKNSTEKNFTVKLYPKSKYMDGTLFDFSDFGGGHIETEFLLEANNENLLYQSNNLNYDPAELAGKIFDSILITQFSSTTSRILFSPEFVLGYSENLFSDDSLWNYEVRHFDLPTNFEKNPVESHDFIFEITENKFAE